MFLYQCGEFCWELKLLDRGDVDARKTLAGIYQSEILGFVHMLTCIKASNT